MANCKSAGFLVPKGNPFDYGMRNIKMQERFLSGCQFLAGTPLTSIPGCDIIELIYESDV